jgi:hypothetical protein
MKCSTELLLSAAFVLTPRDHWTKGAYQISTPKGPAYCVYGALIHAQVQRQCRPAAWWMGPRNQEGAWRRLIALDLAACFAEELEAAGLPVTLP